MMQVRKGPRVLLKRFFATEVAHEYFVSLSELKDAQETDCCSICYTELGAEMKFSMDHEIPDMSGSLHEFLNRTTHSIMRTPCNHYFHVYCLVTLMNYKHNCPLCRQGLPNLEY